MELLVLIIDVDWSHLFQTSIDVFDNAEYIPLYADSVNNLCTLTFLSNNSGLISQAR